VVFNVEGDVKHGEHFAQVADHDYDEDGDVDVVAAFSFDLLAEAVVGWDTLGSPLCRVCHHL
jgi:hypothetical protein